MYDQGLIPPVYKKPAFQQSPKKNFPRKKKEEKDEEGLEKQEVMERNRPPSIDGESLIDLTA